MAHITLLARGVILHENTSVVGAGSQARACFLLGGHVEQGEWPTPYGARVYEEMEVNAKAGDFLGAIEATWGEDSVHHELNLLFRVTLAERSYEMPVPSREPHLRFFRANLDELAAHNLLPIPLRQLLRQQPSGAWWASAIGEK